MGRRYPFLENADKNLMGMESIADMQIAASIATTNALQAKKAAIAELRQKIKNTSGMYQHAIFRINSVGHSQPQLVEDINLPPHEEEQQQQAAGSAPGYTHNPTGNHFLNINRDQENQRRRNA